MNLHLIMKSGFVLIILSAALPACNLLSPSSGEHYDLSAEFSMTDTAGQISTHFRSGQSFLLSFTLTNVSADTFACLYVGPEFSFGVFRQDTIVTRSYGCEISLYPHPDTLRPGEFRKATWKGPTPVCPPNHIVLPAGIYQARVDFPVFANAKVNSVPMIRFAVTE